MKTFLESILIGFFLSVAFCLSGQTVVLTTSGNFQVPAGVTEITVEAWGGGGGGALNAMGARGGGAGGSYAKSTLTVTPGAMIPYTVGVGGANGVAGTNSTWNGSTVIATGGDAGSGTSGGDYGGGSIGDIFYNGGNGADASGNNGGGGGGSATISSSGGNGVGTTGGTGTGNGGNGGIGNNDGTNGNTPGAGGGGKGGPGAGSSSGAGADGQIIVTYTNTLCSTFTLAEGDVIHPQCFGGSDGFVSVVVTGGAGGNYAFSWDDNLSTDSVRTGLPVGSYKVYVSDNAGCEDSLTIILVVGDSAPPMVTCMNINANLNDNGMVTIMPADVYETGSDNCGIVNLVSVIPNNFDCTSIGMQSVTLTVNDGNSNTATCTAQVNVRDVTPPVFTCQDITVSLNASGTFTITSANFVRDNIQTFYSDNCATQSLTFGITRITWTCTDVGTNSTTTIFARDQNGNQTPCTINVTAQDNIPPTAFCQDVTVSLDNTGMVTIPGSSVNNNSTDNCTASLSYSLSTSTFDCTNLGANAVVLTVTDPGGLNDNCNATVTVEDNLPPVLECRNLTVELDNNGQISVDASNLLFEYPEYLIYDSGLSGWGPAGACGARRRGSTSAMESFTWVDELSSLSGVGSIQIEISMHFSQTNNPYTFSLNGTDIGQEFGIGLGGCLADVKVIQLDLSLYNVGGTNTFSWNLPDGEHALITNLGWNESFARVVITGIDPSLSDNCSDMNSIVLNPSTFQFTCNDVGNNTVTLEAIDEYSNAAFCTTTVTVKDNIPPFTSCQNVTISLGNNGEVILPALSVDNGSSDACGIMSFNLSQTTFTCDHLGSNIVTLTVIDNNSNLAVCTATVTVQDVSPPTAVCQDITINLDNIGMISISGTDVNDNSTDNCLASLSYSLSSSTFDCGNIGANTVVLTVTDGGLLSSTCESTVTVNHIFATIADGDYALPTTWSGGCVPPNPIPFGAMVNINHDLENNDLLTNNGTITSTTDFINNGTYRGTGSFIGNFINNGIVKPGTGN